MSKGLDIRFLNKLSKCTACTVSGPRTAPVKPTGIATVGCYMIIGNSPTKSALKAGYPFVGHRKEYLDDYLYRCGIKKEDCWFTHAVKCPTFFCRKLDPLEIDICSNLWLQREINMLEPKIIFIIGADAFLGVRGFQLNHPEINSGVVYSRGKDKWSVVLPDLRDLTWYRELRDKFDMTIPRIKEILSGVTIERKYR